MNFELITDSSLLTSLGWDAFIASHPDGNVFQSPEMHELFSKTHRMKPVMIGVADRDTRALKGILSGVIIRELNGFAGYFSSRTVIYGGPLIDPAAPDRQEILRYILDGLISQVKNHSIFIQFRNFSSQEEYMPVFNEKGFVFRDRLNLIVDTSSFEMIKKHMSPSRHRQIKKGLGQGQLDKVAVGQLDKGKSHAKIITPENIGQVREFYEILHDLYRRKVKKPLPAWDFFEQFYHISKDGRLGTIQLVEYQGGIIGGILSPVTPGKTIYEWYVCGLDQQYREVHPSVLATWAALDFAVKNNIPRFDFMGVGVPDREYGVRDFKSRFGGEMVNYGRFARVNNRFIYVISEIGYNVMTLLKKI